MCDFVIIDIMENLTPDQMIDRAIKTINSQETLMVYVINIYYKLLVMIISLMNHEFIYSRNFKISDVLIKYGDDARLADKPHLLVVLDNGIKVFDYLIPYEYITCFNYLNNTVNVMFYGRVEFDKKSAKIVIGKCHSALSFKVNNPSYVCNLIKRNMYYHIKYNGVDKNALEFKMA